MGSLWRAILVRFGSGFGSHFEPDLERSKYHGKEQDGVRCNTQRRQRESSRRLKKAVGRGEEEPEYELEKVRTYAKSRMANGILEDPHSNLESIRCTLLRLSLCGDAESKLPETYSFLQEYAMFTCSEPSVISIASLGIPLTVTVTH